MPLFLPHLPLVPQDESMLMLVLHLFNIIASGATVFGVLFGVLSVLPNFVKQKKVEHTSLDAKEAWKILPEAEFAVTQLFVYTQQAHQNPELINAAKELDLQLQVVSAFNRLRNALLLLRHNAGVADMAEWIERLEKILKYNHKDVALSFITIDLLIQFGVLKKNNPGFQQFDGLRDILLSIYEMRDEKSFPKQVSETGKKI